MHVQSTNGPAKHLSKAEAVLAGVIMMAISTTLLIVWLGSSETILELLGRGKKMQVHPLSAPNFTGIRLNWRLNTYSLELLLQLQ